MTWYIWHCVENGLCYIFSSPDLNLLVLFYCFGTGGDILVFCEQVVDLSVDLSAASAAEE